MSAIADEELAEWRKEYDGRMMTSAIWEYCPSEFGMLLDEVVQQRAMRAKLMGALEKIVNGSVGVLYPEMPGYDLYLVAVKALSEANNPEAAK